MTEITSENAANPLKILNIYRLVETQCGFDTGAVLSRCDVVLSQHQVDHVARNEAH